MFRLVSNPKHLVFEKDMLFTSAKQFKDAITEYAVKGGWRGEVYEERQS